MFRHSDSLCRCAFLKLFVVFLYELCLVTVLVGTRNTMYLLAENILEEKSH